MPDDVLLNKISTIERCLSRIEEEYRGHEADFEHNLTRQDAIILNLQRACEASIDLAMHWINRRRLGLPQTSRQAFVLLANAGLIDSIVCDRLQAMVGFRNIAIHNYQDLNLDIVRKIIECRLGDFTALAEAAIKATNNWREDT